MNVPVKLAAWVCILSTFLAGCTSTTLIQPEAENAEKINSGEIERLITKDGTKYDFEGYPKGQVVAGMVRGISGGKPVAIPLSDVDKVLIRESDTGLTILAVVGGAIVVVGLIVVATGGTHVSTGGGIGLEGR